MEGRVETPTDKEHHTMKTFSRARAAKAAVQKVLENHEAVGEVETFEVTEGRFSAKVTFPADTKVSPWMAEDLNGFEWAVAVVFEEQPGGVGYPAPAPVTAEEAAEVKEPKKVGSTKRVWQMADSMPGATRKEVVAACVAEGVNPGTARTQYQHWFAANKKG
jgi:hypothetical protein